MRVLVVEDEIVQAMVMAQELFDAGFEVVGPVGVLDAAMRMAHEAAIDAAVLDIDLRGRAVYPVADILIGRGIPFVFFSGYTPDAILPRYRAYASLQKPAEFAQLARMLRTVTYHLPA